MSSDIDSLLVNHRVAMVRLQESSQNTSSFLWSLRGWFVWCLLEVFYEC